MEIESEFSERLLNYLDGIQWLQDRTNFVPNTFIRGWRMNLQQGDEIN